MLSKMSDNVHRLVVTFPMGMGDVNSYLIEGKNGYTVVDVGMDLEEAKEVWNRVLEKGIHIEKVVITHTHEDHVGLARWFQESIGVPVITSKLGIEEMKKRRTVSMEEITKFFRKFGGPTLPKKFLGHPSLFDFTPDSTFDNHETILLGDDLYETIWTPGHAPDHFCFYNREKNILIVGDHILKEISPVIGILDAKEGNPLKDYFHSLEILKEYSPHIALTGHGEPIFQFQKRLKELQIRHQERLDQVSSLIKDDYKSVAQICEEIYGTMDIIIDLSAFMATLTRCLYLEDIGKVERKVEEDIVVFKAISN